MYIAIDFDGTIVDHRFPDIGPFAPNAELYLRLFQTRGVKLLLHTVRSKEFLDEAIEFLRANGFDFYGYNENPDQKSWSTSPKTYAHVYVDDAAIGCPLIQPPGFERPCVDWAAVGPLVLAKIDAQMAFMK